MSFNAQMCHHASGQLLGLPSCVSRLPHGSSSGSSRRGRYPSSTVTVHTRQQAAPCIKHVVQPMRNIMAAAGPTTMQSGMQGQVDPGYLSAASYLAEVGFANKTEIARVLDIAMNPNSLFVQASVNVNARALTVNEDMRPVVEFLQGQGLSAADVVKVITAHPPVLSYSVDGRLVPFWEYLTSIGVPNVAAAVAKRPSLLGLSVDASLKKIVGYLQYIETPSDKIVEYICNTI